MGLFDRFKKKEEKHNPGDNFSDEDRKLGAAKSAQVRRLKKIADEMQQAQEILFQQEQLQEQISNLKLLRRERELDIKEREAELNGTDEMSFEDQQFSKILEHVWDRIDHNNTHTPVQATSGIVDLDAGTQNPQNTNSNSDDADSDDDSAPGQAEDLLARIQEMPPEKYNKFVKMLEKML